jgi:small subunit ribosomal protein S16
LAVRLRLRRMGRKKKPFYRIVAADQRKARTGGFLEVLGIYDPLLKPHKVEINEERIAYWLERGAQPSDTVRSLLKQKGITYKRELAKKGLPAEQIVEEMRKWEVIQIEKGRRREAAKARAKKTKAEKAEAAEAKPEVQPTATEPVAAAADVVAEKPVQADKTKDSAEDPQQ